MFRRRIGDLCLRPALDYAAYHHGEEGVFRFTGEVESLTGGDLLWVNSPDLTLPVVLTGAQVYTLPMPEDGAASFDPGREIPRRIRWDRISALSVGTNVFVGGPLVLRKDRRVFVSTRENPLLVIFYDGSGRSFISRVIRAGRHRNEYWNPITPYALILGALSHILTAVSFLSRPAFQLTALTAFIAVFIPLFPLFPPGVLLTILYRRLWRRARTYRAFRDMVRFPLKYLSGGDSGRAGGRAGGGPEGERCGYVRYRSLPEFPGRTIPLLIPGGPPRRGEEWYVFGALPGGDAGDHAGDGAGTGDKAGGDPREPRDPFAPYGAIPGNPETLGRRYTLRAYALEVISWIILLAGIGLNAFFIGIIVLLLR
jgi:hypothetical protein